MSIRTAIVLALLVPSTSHAWADRPPLGSERLGEVEHLGPISLPHPERLQEGRPNLIDHMKNGQVVLAPMSVPGA